MKTTNVVRLEPTPDIDGSSHHPTPAIEIDAFELAVRSEHSTTSPVSLLDSQSLFSAVTLRRPNSVLGIVLETAEAVYQATVDSRRSDRISFQWQLQTVSAECSASIVSETGACAWRYL
jgi:hypothetical protein